MENNESLPTCSMLITCSRFEALTLKSNSSVANMICTWSIDQWSPCGPFINRTVRPVAALINMALKRVSEKVREEREQQWVGENPPRGSSSSPPHFPQSQSQWWKWISPPNVQKAAEWLDPIQCGSINFLHFFSRPNRVVLPPSGEFPFTSYDPFAGDAPEMKWIAAKLAG